MYASNDARWRALGDRSPGATLRQPLRSLYIGKRAARARALGWHCSCFRSRIASLFRDDSRLCKRSAFVSAGTQRLLSGGALLSLLSSLVFAMHFSELCFSDSALPLVSVSALLRSPLLLHLLVVRNFYNCTLITNPHFW